MMKHSKKKKTWERFLITVTMSPTEKDPQGTLFPMNFLSV